VSQKALVKEKLEKFDLHITVMDILERTADLTTADFQPDEESKDNAMVLSKTGDCSTQIKLCNIIKKTIGWTPSSSAMVGMFVQAVRDRAAWFDKKMEAQAKSMAGGLQQFEMEMLQEMGETLLVCISYINEEVLKARIEDNLYCLIGCGVEAL
jgi:hypothetical protein